MPDRSPSVLIIGASRGLGLALAAEHLDRGWDVTATVRGEARTELHDLADAHPDRLAIEHLDMTEPEQIAALGERLAGTTFDLLLVNAAVTNGDTPAGEVDAATFADVMVTNALSPLRVVEALDELVAGEGTIAVMSSTQGSITRNDNAGYEVYRASKSALNQLVRSYAVRHADDGRTVLLLCPGHVRTELGGDGAPLGVQDSIPPLVDVIQAHAGDGGLQFRNRLDEVVPW